MTKSEQLESFNHVTRNVGPLVQARINALQIGQKMQDLPEALWHDSFRFYVKEDPTRRGGPNLRLIRLDPTKPSLTVTAFVYNKFVHPYENRYITPREAARLQDFPDTFLFKGTLTSVQQQVGNAVPLRLGWAVAKAILKHARQYGTLDDYLKSDPKRIPILSLFTGVGGLDMGFDSELLKSDGVAFAAAACVEFDKACCRTLSANLGHAIEPTDIRQVESARGYLRQMAGIDAVPLIIGGPPCQAFSQAGRQKADADDRGRMIFEYLRVVGELRPTYFVMENVANLKGVSGGGLFAATLAQMKDLGYTVKPYKLSAADYGTAQLRQRLVFIGVRDPYPVVEPPERTHTSAGEIETLGVAVRPHRTVGEAFAGLPALMPVGARSKVAGRTNAAKAASLSSASP
jgi:DNA (cytosine-5)-methyltransferase 1